MRGKVIRAERIYEVKGERRKKSVESIYENAKDLLEFYIYKCNMRLVRRKICFSFIKDESLRCRYGALNLDRVMVL